MIDNFSAKDLGPRVKMVALLGILIVILTAAGAFLLYNRDFAISVPAAGEWKDVGLAAISIEKEELQNVPSSGEITLDITAKDGRIVSFPAKVLEITPQNGVMLVNIDDKARGVIGKDYFDLRVVFSHAKLWKFLTSKTVVDSNE